MNGETAVEAGLTGELARYAAELGFVACGVATLEPNRYGDALERWLSAGYAGTMRYLHRQAAKRKHPATIAPGARVAVVVLENYLPPETPVPRSPFPVPRVEGAKYARGAD